MWQIVSHKWRPPPLKFPVLFFHHLSFFFFLLWRASFVIKLSLHCQTLTGCTNPRCCRSSPDPSCWGGRSPGLKPMGRVPPPASPPKFPHESCTNVNIGAELPVGNSLKKKKKTGITSQMSWHFVIQWESQIITRIIIIITIKTSASTTEIRQIYCFCSKYVK